MTHRNGMALVAMIAVALGAGIMLWHLWPQLRPQDAAATSGQTRLDIKVIVHSANMKCGVLSSSGRSVLSFTPPIDRDRQLAVISPKGEWMSITPNLTAVHKGVARTFLIDPASQRVTESIPDGGDFKEVSNRPFFRGDGIYEIVLSETLDIDIELIEWQANCRVRIWRK